MKPKIKVLKFVQVTYYKRPKVAHVYQALQSQYVIASSMGEAERVFKAKFPKYIINGIGLTEYTALQEVTK